MSCSFQIRTKNTTFNLKQLDIIELSKPQRTEPSEQSNVVLISILSTLFKEACIRSVAQS